MTPKVRHLLDRCNVHINLSIDSLVPERYESIRVNADFRAMMANFELFRTYCHERDRTLCVMVNPMRENWMEMADYVRWANARDVHLWFNTIRYPENLALHNLPAEELAEVYETLDAEVLPEPVPGRFEGQHRHNLGVFDRFVHHQVATWRDEAASTVDRLVGVPVELGRKTSSLLR